MALRKQFLESSVTTVTEMAMMRKEGEPDCMVWELLWQIALISSFLSCCFEHKKTRCFDLILKLRCWNLIAKIYCFILKNEYKVTTYIKYHMYLLV